MGISVHLLKNKNYKLRGRGGGIIILEGRVQKKVWKPLISMDPIFSRIRSSLNNFEFYSHYMRNSVSENYLNNNILLRGENWEWMDFLRNEFSCTKHAQYFEYIIIYRNRCMIAIGSVPNAGISFFVLLKRNVCLFPPTVDGSIETVQHCIGCLHWLKLWERAFIYAQRPSMSILLSNNHVCFII